MPGDLASERFNGGADDVAITTTNSTISGVVNGTPTFENTDRTPVEGSASMKTIQTAVTSVRFDFSHTGAVLYANLAIYSNANPSAAQVIASIQNTSTVRGQIRRNTDGGFQLRNGTTAVATGVGIAAGVDCRLEWKMDFGGGTQSLAIYKGTNLWGATPDETISGALTNATRNRLVLGTVAAASTTAGSYHLIDFVDISSTGFEPPPATGITGTLSSTLPAATAAVTGTANVAGSLSGTVPALAAASTGTVPVSGSLAGTVPALGASVTGGTRVAGSVAATLPGSGASVAATAAVAGSVAATLPGLTASTTATAKVQGSPSATLPALTGTATGATLATGAVNAALPAMGASLAGSVIGANVLNATLPPLTGTTAGTVNLRGNVAATLPGLLAVAEAEAVVSAAFQATVLPGLLAALRVSVVNTTSTPAERVVVLAAEPRTVAIAYEPRTVTLPAEPRAVVLEAEPRTVAVPADTRTLTPI